MIIPRNEPEIVRAKGRRCVELNNRITRKPYGNHVFRALELAEQAYRVHKLPYEPGLSAMGQYPPDRFTWFYSEAGNPKKCVRVRDDKTGKAVVWPHWAG